MWHRLYLPLDESSPLVEALRSLGDAQGYQFFDPFPGGTGTPPGLVETVRLFVAPPQDGWVCVLGQPDETWLLDLSKRTGVPVLYGWLTEENGGFARFYDGIRRDDPAVFEPYLRPEQTLGTLQQAFEGQLAVPVVDSEGQPPVIVAGADGLPPEIQQIAQDRDVDLNRVEKIWQRLSDSIFGKLARQFGGETTAEQAQAREIFSGGRRDLWNSQHGQRVRAIAGVLRLPANWQEPSWDTVRDAYQVHRLRQRSPRMPLIPSDREAMAALPEALDYTPVYMGRA